VKYFVPILLRLPLTPRHRKALQRILRENIYGAGIYNGCEKVREEVAEKAYEAKHAHSAGLKTRPLQPTESSGVLSAGQGRGTAPTALDSICYDTQPYGLRLTSGAPTALR